MTDRPIFAVEVDEKRNLMWTRYRGSVTAADAERGVGMVDAALPQLRPGFSVLADFTGLESMEVECGPHIAKIMELCKARHVGLVVRLIPDPRKDIGMNILSLVHYRGAVKIVTCSTLAEAQRALG